MERFLLYVVPLHAHEQLLITDMALGSDFL